MHIVHYNIYISSGRKTNPCVFVSKAKRLTFKWISFPKVLRLELQITWLRIYFVSSIWFHFQLCECCELQTFHFNNVLCICIIWLDPKQCKAKTIYKSQQIQSNNLPTDLIQEHRNSILLLCSMFDMAQQQQHTNQILKMRIVDVISWSPFAINRFK